MLKLLTAVFDSGTLRVAEPADIAAVYGIGPEIAQSVYQWFHIPANQTLIERLEAASLQLLHKHSETNYFNW